MSKNKDINFKKRFVFRNLRIWCTYQQILEEKSFYPRVHYSNNFLWPTFLLFWHPCNFPSFHLARSNKITPHFSSECMLEIDIILVKWKRWIVINLKNFFFYLLTQHRAGGTGVMQPQYLADTLTLFKSGGVEAYLAFLLLFLPQFFRSSTGPVTYRQ